MYDERKNSGGVPQHVAVSSVHVYDGVSATVMILTDYRGSPLFAAAVTRFPHSVVFIVATLSELYTVLFEAEILELPAIAAKKGTEVIWKAYFAGRRADLLLCGYAVLDGFAESSKVPAEVFNVLEQPPYFSVEPLQTVFDLVISNGLGKEVLEEENKWNL